MKLNVKDVNIAMGQCVSKRHKMLLVDLTVRTETAADPGEPTVSSV